MGHKILPEIFFPAEGKDVQVPSVLLAVCRVSDTGFRPDAGVGAFPEKDPEVPSLSPGRVRPGPVKESSKLKGKS